MIESCAGAIELICDDCGEAYPMTHEAEDRDVLLADAKASGWRFYKHHQDWCHACPSCVRAFAAQTRRLL